MNFERSSHAFHRSSQDDLMTPPAVGKQTLAGSTTSSGVGEAALPTLGTSGPSLAPDAGQDPLLMGKFLSEQPELLGQQPELLGQEQPELLAQQQPELLAQQQPELLAQQQPELLAQRATPARSAFPATIGSGRPGGATGRGGAETSSVLPLSGLKPLDAEITGPQMLIVDNPETFRRAGVLASTMAPVRDRGDTTHDFVGVARYFALSQNATGKALRNLILVKNTSNKDLELRLHGEVFCNKGITKTDGRIQQNYKADGEFQGPHAIASSAYLDAQNGKNGFVSKSVKIKAGDTEIVNDQYHESGSEVFALVEMTATDPKATFRIAGVAHEKSLTEEEENKVGRGDWAAAGDPTKEDFAGADKNRLGRPNGVITAGSVVTGGRVFEVKAGSRDGDAVMATRFKNAGESDAVQIAKPLPNKDPARNGAAATSDDGNYGMEYRLQYGLKNTSDKPVTAQLLFTAPKSNPKEVHKPMGGEIVMPMEVDGKRVEVRVNARGGGVEVGKWTVQPGATKDVAIRFVNFGNIFPPAGFEVRGA